MFEDPIKNLPNILLVTDSLPHPMATGTAKTLYNLLNGYPPEKLVIFCEPGEEKGIQDPLAGTLLPVRLSFVQQMSNRLGALGFNRLAFWVNGWLRRLLPLPGKNKLPETPEVILMATIWHNRLVTGIRLGKKYDIPVVPFLLDLWPESFNPGFGGISFQKAIVEVLSKASGWMVISRSLQGQLEKIFAIKAPPTLVVHNPTVAAVEKPSGKKDQTQLSVVYAGSLFDMHFDSLMQTAKAIQIMSTKGLAATLKVFCKKEHWDFRRGQLEPLGVLYGGFLHPDELMKQLQKASLLLVTASFADSERFYSACSLQTKVTEYMGCGVPIISIGPAYGECNRFFSEHQCGFVVDQNDPEAIAAALREIWVQPLKMEAMAKRALSLAAVYFGQAQTQERFFGFMVQIMSKATQHNNP